MAYDVQFTGPARRALLGIPPRVVPAIIEFAFGDLAREPHRVGKPLERELSGLFSARRGPYRLLDRIDDAAQRVYIVQIDHRADVYRPRTRQSPSPADLIARRRHLPKVDPDALRRELDSVLDLGL